MWRILTIAETFYSSLCCFQLYYGWGKGIKWSNVPTLLRTSYLAHYKIVLHLRNVCPYFVLYCSIQWAHLLSLSFLSYVIPTKDPLNRWLWNSRFQTKPKKIKNLEFCKIINQYQCAKEKKSWSNEWVIFDFSFYIDDILYFLLINNVSKLSNII